MAPLVGIGINMLRVYKICVLKKFVVESVDTNLEHLI